MIVSPVWWHFVQSTAVTQSRKWRDRHTSTVYHWINHGTPWLIQSCMHLYTFRPTNTWNKVLTWHCTKPHNCLSLVTAQWVTGSVGGLLVIWSWGHWVSGLVGQLVNSTQFKFIFNGSTVQWVSGSVGGQWVSAWWVCWSSDTSLSLSSHQRSHLSGGFIADVDGQLNSREKSREFEIAPRTRNLAKLCGSRSIRRWAALGRMFSHHTYTTMQNN